VRKGRIAPRDSCHRKACAAKIKIPLSIDTMKPAVARAALEAGASIVNDVGGKP
jgi:dihydropteroate synthase